MAFVLSDRVQETCTSPGTGTVSLLGAVVGFQAFSTGVGNNNVCYYTIADQGGPNWEVGIGTYSSSGNTLTRGTVLSSSNGGSLTNFSTGTQSVFVDYPAEKAVYLDNAGNVSALGSISSGTWNASTIAVAKGGTGVTTSTGSGSVVLSNSPSLTTPNLDTPSAITLTNATGLPLSTGVSGTLPTANGGTNLSSFTSGGAMYATSTSALTTGTLPVASGGTGATTSTGTGAVVLNSGPSITNAALTTPNIGAATGTSLNIGTLTYVGANTLLSAESSVNNYNQIIVQNASSGTTASSNVVVNNDNSTDDTYYGSFGMNSSGFTGTGPFQAPNAVYLESASSDLVVGTKTSNSIHFVINDSATDAVTINTNGALAVNGSYGTSGQVLTSAGSGAAPTWESGVSSTYTRTSFTATAGQTVFTVSYTAGYVEVFLNGVLLNASDYTASSGTSITLSAAAAAGDIVEVIAYSISSIATSTATSLLGGTAGQIVYQSAPNTTAFVATGTTGQAFISNGTSAPSWGAVGIAGGGTNQTSYTAPSGNVSGLIFYNGTSFTNDSTVTDAGYDTVTHTLNARNFTFSGTSIATGGAYQEHKVAMAANDIDLSTANYFSKTITTTTTLTVSNTPTTGTVASFILDLTNGGSSTVTWWSNVKWAGGTAPTLTSSGRDVLGFFTYDAGTTWTGLVLGKDVK